jgi:3-dehydroquinate synthase
LHGEAVAVGMVMAADLSHRLGWLSGHDVARIEALVRCARLPVRAPSAISPARFLELMSVDKKAINGHIRLILLKAIGQAVIVDDCPSAALEATLTAMREPV